MSIDSFFAAMGAWETPTDWSLGFPANSMYDAYIGLSGASTVTSDDDQTVDSINSNSLSVLVIADNSTFIAIDGTDPVVSGNLGGIDVDVGSTLEIGGASNLSGVTFENGGVLDIGAITGAGGEGNLTLVGPVTLDGGGKVDLGQQSPTSHAFSRGSITGSGLVNVDNTISGGGSIALDSFDNQAKGIVEATQAGGNALQISATTTTFSNEGSMIAGTGATLDLGQDGATNRFGNDGTIGVDAGADLAISGNFTLAGNGKLALKGAGAEITSDGRGAVTFTNDDEIVAKLANAQIGDEGALGVNDLTFDNGNIVAVTGAGDKLTLDTGGNAIVDGGGPIFGGGVLEAEDDGVLAIDSPVYVGAVDTSEFSTGGTVEAASGGIVMLAAAVTNGPPANSVSGEVLIEGGTLEMLPGASDMVPVEFTGPGGNLDIDGGAAPSGSIGFGADDSIELHGFDAKATESVTNDVLTIKDGALSETLYFDNATYTTAQFGVIQVATGYDTLSLQTSFTGGGYTLDLAAGSLSVASLSSTAGDFDAVDGANGTVDLDSAQAVVTGGADTVDFISTSGDAATVSATLGHFDSVNGSNGTVYLASGQAVVTGSDDVIDFVSGAGDATTIAGTSGHFDAVNGSNGTVYLTAGQAVVTGGGDTVDFISGSGDAATVSATSGHFDSVNGSDGTVYLSSGQAVVTGGGDVIDFISGAGDAATVSATAGNWDSVNGSNGTVYLTSGQAVVTGGGDTVDFVSGSGNAVTLANSGGNFDLVNATSGTIYLTSAQAAVTGGDNTMQFVGGSGNALSLYSTGGIWDSVSGSNGTVYLNSAQAGVSGSGDTIEMMGTSSMTQSGASDAFIFQAAIGVEKINGFDSTDTMQFSASDFANFSAMMSHTIQSGSATVIKLDASDKVTLTNTLDTSLVASQFHFV